MLSVALAFLGSFIYGGSDFFGGLAASRMSAIKVTAINAIAGVALLLVASLFIGGRWSGGVLLWGGLGGLAGAASLGLLYACLAMGPMSILAPIMALASAVVPIGVGFISGERLTPSATSAWWWDRWRSCSSASCRMPVRCVPAPARFSWRSAPASRWGSTSCSSIAPRTTVGSRHSFSPSRSPGSSWARFCSGSGW